MRRVTSRMISGIKARAVVTAYARPYILSSLYMGEQFFVLSRSRQSTDGEPPFRSILSREEKENGVEMENRAAAISPPRFPLSPSNDFRIVPAVRTDRPAEF